MTMLQWVWCYSTFLSSNSNQGAYGEYLVARAFLAAKLHTPTITSQICNMITQLPYFRNDNLRCILCYKCSIYLESLQEGNSASYALVPGFAVELCCRKKTVCVRRWLVYSDRTTAKSMGLFLSSVDENNMLLSMHLSWNAPCVQKDFFLSHLRQRVCMPEK